MDKCIAEENKRIRHALVNKSSSGIKTNAHVIPESRSTLLDVVHIGNKGQLKYYGSSADK